MTIQTYADTVSYSTLNSSLQAFANRFKGAKLKIYDGVRPATGAAITTQNLLATLSFPTIGTFAPAFPSLVANLPLPPSVAATGTGTATWFRVTINPSSPYGGFNLVGMAGATIMDGNVGTSGADLNLSSVVITPGKIVAITAFPIQINQP